jgi:hypothetical protein
VSRSVDVACLAVTGLSGVVTDQVDAAVAGLRRPLTGISVRGVPLVGEHQVNGGRRLADAALSPHPG